MNHAMKRALQRFALDLNKKDLDKIIWAIQNHKSVSIQKQGKYKCIHAVNYDGIILYPVYHNNNSPKIRTFLSSGMVLKKTGMSNSAFNNRIKRLKEVRNIIPKEK